MQPIADMEDDQCMKLQDVHGDRCARVEPERS